MDDSVGTVEHEVLEYLSRELLRASDVPAPGVDEDLFATGLVDSLNIMRLVTHVRDAFQISIDPPDLMPGNFHTVRAIGAFVQRKQAEESR